MNIRFFHILPATLACGLLVELSGCGTNETLKNGSSSDAGKILGTGGRSGDGSVRGTGGRGGAVASTVLGKKCLNDKECKAPFICLESSGNDFGTGGPANGICTIDCTNDSDCQAVDTNSICVQIDSASGTQVCLQTCIQGVSSNTKCQGRSDMICEGLLGSNGQLSGDAACQPACGGDFDCSGRKCDLRSGYCKDAPAGTLPVGSPCDANAVKDPCNGSCVNFTDSLEGGLSDPKYASCAAVCVAGTLGCGNDTNATPPYNWVCLSTSTDAPGDPGLCFELCDCNDDCKNPAFICRGFGDASSVDTTGHQGYCTDPLDSKGAMMPGLACNAPPGTGGAGGVGGARGTGGAAGAAGGGGKGGTAVRDAGAD